MAILEVKNIEKSFDSLQVLRGIDFSLEKGQVLAIIGSSGSGKTTLLRCLNFLERPSAGRIILNGEVLFDAGDPMLRRDSEIRRRRLRFGLVFQSFNLFPQYNVLENVTLAGRLQLREAEREKRKEPGRAYSGAHKARAEEKLRRDAVALIERVGLSDKLYSYPFELSGGQQQRVAIARALALNPTILCFDEPTSALDPELTGEVLKVIRELKGADSTMIVVTHEMSFAKSIADQVIFMSDGVIVEQGTPQAVFDNPQNEKTKAFLSRSLEEM